MEKNENTISHNFTLDSFAKAKDRMIATNDNAYGASQRGSYWSQRNVLRDYSASEVHAIIDSGSSSEQQRLSRQKPQREARGCRAASLRPE